MSTMSYTSIWNETLQKIQESNYFDSHTFNSWISKTTLFKIEDNIAYVAYRSTITFSILKKQKEKELIFFVLWMKICWKAVKKMSEAKRFSFQSVFFG